GLIGNMSISDNLVLKSTDTEQFSSGHGLVLKKKAIADYAHKMAEKYDVRCSGIDQDVRNLSGGNQQKVIIAKWLVRSCDVLIFDEPTRGIDVGAKSEIYKLMNELAAEGKAIIMISSELQEVMRMSDRVVCMCEGRLTKILDIQDATQEVIMKYATQRS
ncbi:MAG: ATP-binding cassette domain-containing protein, partial [Oscillospiraceae bacterium]